MSATLEGRNVTYEDDRARKHCGTHDLYGCGKRGHPAVAQSVPVDVPLDAVKATLGVDTPRVGTGVPMPVVGAPESPRFHKGNMLPTPLLPSVPVGTELGSTLVTSPVPNLLGKPETDGEGSVKACGHRPAGPDARPGHAAVC